MNSIFLHDPNEIRLPPEEVRLTEVEVKPQPNGTQVKVHIVLTPFMKRPSIEVSIASKTGTEAGHTHILETMLHDLEFTMHLRQAEAGEELTMVTTVYYQKLPAPSETPMELPLPEPMIVDRNTTIFKLKPVET